MYLPPHFAQDDPEAISAMIAEHPLGVLVTMGPEGLDANHIPFLLDPGAGERGRLIGHVARSNPVWREHDAAVESLVVFRGATAYISPNWYPSKQETHEVVPTYNYAVVHVHGPLVVHEDAKWLRGVVGRLTKAMEAAQPVPWRMADAPAPFLDRQLADIVGVEIPIRRIVAKWKASQNRAPADRAGAVLALRTRATPESVAMAELVREGGG